MPRQPGRDVIVQPRPSTAPFHDGYRRLHILPRRESWSVNHTRTYRLYREEGFSVCPKVPQRKRT
jgi:hypothetical protein